MGNGNKTKHQRVPSRLDFFLLRTNFGVTAKFGWGEYNGQKLVFKCAHKGEIQSVVFAWR